MTPQVVGQADLAFQANLYESGNPTRRWLHHRRQEWVTRALTRWYPGPGRLVFDCGVGCGVYSRRLAACNLQVVGIDLNDSFVQAANAIPGVRAYVADICRPETVSGRAFADLAVCSEVLEHVPEPEVALGLLRDVLAPGGVLVLTTPQRWSSTELTARLLKIPLFERIGRAIYKEPVQELGHISLMTSGQLKQLLQRVGFEVLEHEVFALYLPVIAEFCGAPGQRLLERLEAVVRAVPGLRWLAWTQAYVVRRR